MSEGGVRLLVGGPMDGQIIASTADVIELAETPDMAYHWTQDHRLPDPDPDWWMKGLPEPQPRPRIYEWHERDWESPEVAAIKEAVREASERMTASHGT